VYAVELTRIKGVVGGPGFSPEADPESIALL
jgi:hypothetical protein